MGEKNGNCDIVRQLETYYAIIGGLIRHAEEDHAKGVALTSMAENAVRGLSSINSDFKSQVATAVSQGVFEAERRLVSGLVTSLQDASAAASVAQRSYERAASFSTLKVVGAAVAVAVIAIGTLGAVLTKLYPGFDDLEKRRSEYRDLVNEAKDLKTLLDHVTPCDGSDRGKGLCIEALDPKGTMLQVRIPST